MRQARASTHLSVPPVKKPYPTLGELLMAKKI